MKSKFISFIVLLLFIIAPFIQSDTSDESQPDVLLSLPPIISTISFYLRWIIIGVLVMYFFLNKNKVADYFTKYNLFFALFYFFPMLYAAVSLTDFPRYISLFLLSLILPIVFTSQFQEKHFFFNHKNLQKVILVFIVISIIVSFRTLASGFRFQGILGNANMYGISAVFWLSLIQLNQKSKLSLALTIILFITIVLSGSRGSLVAGIVVIFFAYTKHFVKLFFGSIAVVSSFAILSSYLDLEFIFGRLESISNSSSDSGRQDIWDVAFKYISLNPMGNGMNAPLELVDTGNIHNCYVRFLLTMGYPFTILTLLCLFLLIVFVVKDKKVPKPLVGFLFGYLLANYGEDFFVGVGSSMFIYVIMTIGLISFYSLKKEGL